MGLHSSTSRAGPCSLRPSTGQSSIRLASPQGSEQALELKAPSIHVTPADGDEVSGPKPFKPTWRFWAILLSIAVMTVCGTVESTIIINALPTIVADLGAGPAFIWVPNAFFLASVSGLPLYAQMSNIFGRRNLLLIAVALFMLGTGLCGGSTSIGMLITSRAIQGLGMGGIDMLAETIIMDIVPLRERSKYMSIVLVGGVLGASVGPFLGGVIVVSLGWRWIFYLNLFLAAAAFVMFFIFLKVKHRRDQTFVQQLKRIDYGGNVIFIGSVIAVLLALTWAGPVYSWSSFRIIVPLVLGFTGLLAFVAFEWTPRLAPEPSFPRALVSNRTSAAALFMVFLSNMCLMWTFYFLPIYFQSVLAKSPLQSGIALVPISACVVPFAIVGGTLLSQWGRYKPIHLVAWAFLIVGIGLFSLLDRHSSTAKWAGFEIISSVGSGVLSVTLLPAIQAPLDESHVAAATGMYSFARGFGSIWGITIPSAIFNNEVRRYKDLISDKGIANMLADGKAYERATKAFLDTLTDQGLRDEVIEVFTRAIKTVWYVGIGFAILGFLVTFVEKEIKLRQELNTEFGLEETDANANADDRAGESRATGSEQIELEELAPTRRSR